MNSPEGPSGGLRVRPILEKLMRREELGADEAGAILRALMSGVLPPASVAAFAVALAMKGETVGELTAMAAAMRAAALKINAPAGALDTCGTGGDASGTFNMSTAAALVVAAAGVPVAKHGGRSASSASGSADVLKALGVNVDASPLDIQRCLNEVGIAFLFAPTFHPRDAARGGRAQGIGHPHRLQFARTRSRIPPGAKLQLLGVNKPELCGDVRARPADAGIDGSSAGRVRERRGGRGASG